MSILIETLSLQKTSRRPVWIMRQAGRYLKTFRDLRSKHSFLDICDSSDLSLKVSLLPFQQYELDAAIVFSDILVPLRALGADLKFTEAGPKIAAPQSVSDLQKLRKSFDPQEGTRSILDTLRALRAELSQEKAVLGFAGAPFTMLAYLLEGDLSRDLKIMKRWMAKEPKAVHEWLGILSNVTGEYLDAQAKAGADAVQLFDTWAGVLSKKDYDTFALPYARATLSAVTVPSIYYVNGVAGILESAASVGAQCLSVDWRISISEVRRRVSPVTALQGNLDPYVLLRSRNEIRTEVFEICENYGRGPGHVMNLGHGIVPEIPEDSVKYLIEAVHEWAL